MAVVGDDLLSERLISQLLENDLLLLESMKAAEKLQLDQVMAVSARAKGRIPKFSKVESTISPEMDGDLAVRLYISDARVNNDVAFAQSIQNETHVENTTNHQYALKVAAAERQVLRCIIHSAIHAFYVEKSTWMQNLRGNYKLSTMRVEI